tara:strand:- start:4101 stop:4232 length:132 start_codon:yes stop_codon:yes gene_type:complete
MMGVRRVNLKVQIEVVEKKAVRKVVKEDCLDYGTEERQVEEYK